MFKGAFTMARAAAASTRAGRYISQPSGYRAFVPVPLPPHPPIAFTGEIPFLLSEADRALGRLDGSVLAADLSELERVLVDAGVGSRAYIERAKAESEGLGLFVRSLIGLDRESAKGALDGFLANKTLAANQIEFVNLIVNHLTEHGTMEAARLYESPFTDLTPRGPEGLFSQPAIDELIAVFERVRQTAIAA
jgi:type I restriction enzyme R subunit